MNVSTESLIISAGVSLTAITGFLIHPNVGLFLGLLTLVAGSLILANNRRKHVDERSLEILKTASLQTLTIVIAGSLIVSLSIWILHGLRQITEPSWFLKYSVHTAVIAGIFTITAALETYRTRGSLSEII